MIEDDPLPKWLKGRTFCRINDMMRLFEVSRATIDRWCRQDPRFPKKVRITAEPGDTTSPRFLVNDVRQYLRSLQEQKPE